MIVKSINLITIFWMLMLTFNANAITPSDYGNGLIITENKPFTIWCNATKEELESNDLIIFQWEKNDKKFDQYTISEDDRKRIIFESNNSITIKEPTKDDAADYKCKIRNIEAVIKVRFKPKLFPFEEFQKTNYKSANIIEGEKLELPCEVHPEYSRDAFVKWYRYPEHDSMNLTDLKELKDDRILINETSPTRSVLTIEKVRPTDRAFYVCKSDNNITVANNTILLRVKDKLGALWPFLGIVGEVVILCTIIFIYEKRRVKPDFDESDADHNMETKSLQDRSAKSQDIRQRK